MDSVRAHKLGDMATEIPQIELFQTWVKAGSTWLSNSPANQFRIVKDYMMQVGCYENDPSISVWEEYGYGTEPYQRIRQSLIWLSEGEQNPITSSETFQQFWQLFTQVTTEEMRSKNGFDYSFLTGAFFAASRRSE